MPAAEWGAPHAKAPVRSRRRRPTGALLVLFAEPQAAMAATSGVLYLKAMPPTGVPACHGLGS